MYLIFDVEQWIGLATIFVLLVIALFALVNCLLYSARSYEAAGKLSKQAWSIILGLAVLVELFPVAFVGGRLNFIQIAAVVAPLVYLLDVRPAVAGLYRR